uniref:Uncharacterized protein n=1 Tax=Rhodnius prolixus TaxID=13249 RepID=T1HZT7_RHOPR
MERIGPFVNILPSIKHQMIEDMTSLLNGIITEVVILGERINQIREMLSDLLDSKLAAVASKQDIQELREAYNSMKEENVQLRCELAQLREANLRNEKLLETLDNKLRRQNLIFRGVLKHSPSGKFKRYSEIISEFCSEILKVEIKEDKIHAFPLGSKDNPNSPLLVSFTCFEDKLSVLRAVRILKNTGFVIHQDLAASTRRNRTKLMLVRKELLRLNDQLKTSLRFDGCLTVEGNLPYVDKKVFVDEVDFNAPSREELERCKRNYLN